MLTLSILVKMPEFLRVLREWASGDAGSEEQVSAPRNLIMLILALPEATEAAHLFAQLSFLGDPIEFAGSLAVSVLAFLSLQ